MPHTATVAVDLPTKPGRLDNMYLNPTLHGTFSGAPVTIAAKAGGSTTSCRSVRTSTDTPSMARGTVALAPCRACPQAFGSLATSCRAMQCPPKRSRNCARSSSVRCCQRPPGPYCQPM